MQVSWIDESDMTALLGRLRDPAPNAVEEPSLLASGHLFEDLEPAPALEPDVSPAEPVAEIHITVPATDSHADLDDFRSRLQAIRERAMGAGLLRQSAVTEAPLCAPEPPSLETVPDSPIAAPALEPDPAEIKPDEAVTIDSAPAWPAFQPQGGSVMERLAGFAGWAGPQLPQSEIFVIDDQGDLLWGRSQRQELVLTMVMAWVASSRMSAVFAFNHAPLLRQNMAVGGHLTALPCPTRLGLLHLAITSPEPLADEYLPELRRALIDVMEADG